MSVHRSAQEQADTQFLIVPMELYTSVLEYYHKIPKRYTFAVALPLLSKAEEILDFVIEGNSFPVANQHEAQLRRDQFLFALAKTRRFANKIETIKSAQNLQLIDMKTLESWMQMCNREIALLKGVMKKDSARYKNLP